MTETEDENIVPMANRVGAASDCVPADTYIAAEDRVVMVTCQSSKGSL